MANATAFTNNEVDISEIEVIVNQEPHVFHLLDLPNPTIRKIFQMADISAMARFVCPSLRTLFEDCKIIHASEIQNKGLGLMKWAHEEGMFERADERGVPHSQFITTPELVEWYMQEFDFDKNDAYMLLTTPEILEWAIAGGSERQFMFYLGRDHGPTVHDFVIAAKRGNLDVVKWGHRNGLNKPEWSSLCNSAADGGQLHVLQWARSVTPPYNWGPETTQFAATNGHLNVLKWLRANGCPWNSHTIYVATVQGHDDVAAWALQNGCPTQAPHLN